ncbi:MAG: Hpt domain-containing protein [Verrucomicrobiota bacterium]
MFVSETERRLGELQQHLESQSMEEVARAAHTIKGTAGNFSASQLSRLAREIESSCQSHEVEKVWELLPLIQNEFKKYRSTLEQHA